MILPFDVNEFMADPEVQKAFDFVEGYLKKHLPKLVIDMAKPQLEDDGISYSDALLHALSKSKTIDFDLTYTLKEKIENYFSELEEE